MLIQKEFYLRQLNLRRNNDMIKVITGIRRCLAGLHDVRRFAAYFIHSLG